MFLRGVHAALLFVFVSCLLLSACGGGGGGGNTETNTTTTVVTEPSQLMTWGAAAMLPVSDRYATGAIGDDGSALLIWGKGDASENFVKAYGSYYSPHGNVWSASSLLDSTSPGIPSSVWDSGVQALGTAESSMIQDAQGNWGVWWRYCQRDYTGSCSNTSTIHFQQVTAKSGVWSADQEQSQDYSLKENESFRVLKDKAGHRWVSANQWVAKVSGNGTLMARQDVSGAAFVDSSGNVLVFSPSSNAVLRYALSSDQWASYALLSGQEVPKDAQLIKFFEHGAGRLTIFWKDVSSINTLRLWITEVDSSRGAPVAKTTLIDSGASSYFGEVAASDAGGVVVLRAKYDGSSRSVSALRYDMATGLVSTSLLDSGAPVLRASPMLIQKQGAYYYGVWESKSAAGRVSIKGGILDQSGVMQGAVQELGFFEAGSRDVSAMLHALWLGADGKMNVVWRLYGDGLDVWQSSVCVVNAGASWSPAATVQVNSLIGQFYPYAPALLENSAGDVAGIWFHGLGVAILGLDSAGKVVFGTQPLHFSLLQSSDFISGRAHDDGTITVMGRSTEGSAWVVRSR
jgi:hypothetical protein